MPVSKGQPFLILNQSLFHWCLWKAYKFPRKSLPPVWFLWLSRRNKDEMLYRSHGIPQLQSSPLWGWFPDLCLQTCFPSPAFKPMDSAAHWISPPRSPAELSHAMHSTQMHFLIHTCPLIRFPVSLNDIIIFRDTQNWGLNVSFIKFIQFMVLSHIKLPAYIDDTF